MADDAVDIKKRKHPHIQTQVFGFAFLPRMTGVNGEHIAGYGVVAERQTGKRDAVDQDILADVHVA